MLTIKDIYVIFFTIKRKIFSFIFIN